MHNRIDRLIFGRSIIAAYGEFTEKGPVYMVGVGRVSRAHPDPSVPPARARISNDFENESMSGRAAPSDRLSQGPYIGSAKWWPFVIIPFGHGPSLIVWHNRSH